MNNFKSEGNELSDEYPMHLITKLDLARLQTSLLHRVPQCTIHTILCKHAKINECRIENLE